MTSDQVTTMAREAIDAAFLSIQEKLGVETGDVAGIYCSGNRLDALQQLFEGYIKLELSFRKTPQ